MTQEFLIHFCLALLSYGVGVTALEFFYCPEQKAVWKRGYKSLAVQFLILSALYCLILFITHRVWFSVGVSLCLVLVVLIVNNTKFATLREPLAFSDVFLYLQVFKHPRLYLPFLGGGPVIVCSLIGALVIALGLTLETPSFSWFSLSSLFLIALAFIAFHLASTISMKTGVLLELKKDCHELGVMSTAFIYAFKAPEHRKKIVESLSSGSPFSIDKVMLPLESSVLADIVVVQSESFFDVRELSPEIPPRILAEYDSCLAQSNVYGKLKVPAWGANTMRTEFGFLTGLTPTKLGFAQYYPYQQLLNTDIPSIVGVLKAIGYYCVCVHPNASGFFHRDRFFKQLGFDAFLDDESFDNAVKVGPYISDQSVTEKIKQVLDNADKPCFVFAITMENHGPLHLESVEDDEWEQYYSTSNKEKFMSDLIVYLRHLKNADNMISQLCEYFSSRSSEVIFSFYGDHVPAMDKIFRYMDYEDSRSNYFLWSNSKNEESKRDSETTSLEQVLSIEELPSLIMDTLQKTEAFQKKS